ncbi:peptidylprolyl isomerase, partial [Candidatus Endoriftia persephone str. Guaymas]|nr:peptidylprolyl isomerase [Candidatus Endoriftia persephone str. Guaymas]
LSFDQESGINYLSDDPMQELLAMLRRRLGGADSSKYRLQPESIDYVERQLQRLTHLQGLPVIHLPQMALLSVVGGNAGLHIYTLLRNNAHSNIAHIFREQQRRLPQEDTLSVSRGVVGAYPNLLLRVESSRLAGFVDEIAAMRDQADYRALLDRYGVRRTSADFWLHSDRLHAAYRQQEPIEAGLFDFNRLDND